MIFAPIPRKCSENFCESLNFYPQKGRKQNINTMNVQGMQQVLTISELNLLFSIYWQLAGNLEQIHIEVVYCKVWQPMFTFKRVFMSCLPMNNACVCIQIVFNLDQYPIHTLAVLCDIDFNQAIHLQVVLIFVFMVLDIYIVL